MIAVVHHDETGARPDWMLRFPQDLSDGALIAELERRGYAVTRQSENGWLLLSELAAKLGRKTSSLSRSITRAGGKPPGLEIERAGHGCGRIQRVRPGAEFYQWLRTL